MRLRIGQEPYHAKEPPQTVGDLRRKVIVTVAEIAEAVEGYLNDAKLRTFRFASGHVVDVRAAGHDHWPAKEAEAGPVTSDVFSRTIVRTAVILAVRSAP